MAATFPGGVKVFTTKQAGDQIASAHINDLQDEVVAVETELRKTSGSVVSHGSLAGLSNNDHPQYLLAATGKAADSDKLDGNDSAYFMPISYKDGWTPDSDTWAYVSATSFKIIGKDVRVRFPIGTKLKLTQTSVKYFYVVSVAYSTDTTITVTGGSLYTLTNAAITNPFYSYSETPQDYPFAETIKIRVQSNTDQSIPNNAWTSLSFDTLIFEGKPIGAAAQWSSGSPTRLTCRLPGVYLVIAHTRIAANATGERGINLKKNGVSVIANIWPGMAGFDAHIQVSDIVNLAVDDYIETSVYQNSGAALNAISASSNLYLEWSRLGA